MKQLVLLCGIILSSISVWSAAEILAVDANSKGNEFAAVYTVSEPVDKNNISISYRPRSVELAIEGVLLKEPKSIVKVKHSIVDRVYSRNTDGKVFSRIMLKDGLTGKDLEGRISFETKGNTIRLNVTEKAATPAVKADLDEILDREVAQILSEDMPDKNIAKNESIKETKVLKESEIPVLNKPQIKKSESSSPYSRLILSFVIIGIFGLSVAMVSRWWKKRTTKDFDNSKIKIVTQHFLGPRKSLAIIRVAGETILVGITDQNINMIKSLSLLEEESLGSFGEVLQAKGAEAPKPTEEEEDFSFNHIKDRISNRVKEMRPL